jgi:GAF domain-containing protein
LTSPEFRRRYSASLRQQVFYGSEATLRDGYELGRRAVGEGSSALELATIHHDALASTLASAQPIQVSEIVGAAAAFFQEVLSAFEMVHRGYREAASAAAAERRAAAMLRRLSSFLADTSLSAPRNDTAAEVLHLVAEHGRELADAIYSCATWREAGRHMRARSADPTATPEDEQIADQVEGVADALPTRVSRAEWLSQPVLGEINFASNVLTVPITKLDGVRCGFLQIVNKRTGDFTEVDEAVVVHLANMTAAAFERAQLYDVSQPR